MKNENAHANFDDRDFSLFPNHRFASPNSFPDLADAPKLLNRFPAPIILASPSECVLKTELLSERIRLYERKREKEKRDW